MKWQEFQIVTAQMFEEAGCEVQIEKLVEGVRAEHKVDVMVTFKKYGVDCTWVVECKNWNSNVPKEKVAALQAIVSDIGADRGVVVSNTGFQSGAIRMANSSNITLASLEDLRDYLSEEIEQREIEFVETQLTQLKHELFGLSIREKKSDNPGTWVTVKYPDGVDGKRVMDLAGRICLILSSFEQLKIGKDNFIYACDDESSKVYRAESLEEFLQHSKRIGEQARQFLDQLGCA